jgi:hypothetical protein
LPSLELVLPPPRLSIQLDGATSKSTHPKLSSHLHEWEECHACIRPDATPPAPGTSRRDAGAGQLTSSTPEKFELRRLAHPCEVHGSGDRAMHNNIGGSVDGDLGPKRPWVISIMMSCGGWYIFLHFLPLFFLPGRLSTARFILYCTQTWAYTTALWLLWLPCLWHWLRLQLVKAAQS